jgi:N-acetylglucosamine kinase-like BadF-type ATPase
MIAGSGDLYAGFDLGGTKLSMSLLDRTGEVVRRENIKMPSNISSAGGLNAAGGAIALIARSGYLPDIKAMTFAIAGYSDKGELYNFEQSIRREFANVSILNFMPDYQIFFHSSWPDFAVEPPASRTDADDGGGRVKVIIICGTGSVVLVSAENDDGEYGFYKIFGGGPIMSDPGSGFDLGLRFLRKFGIERALGIADPRVVSLAAARGCDNLENLAFEVKPGSAQAVSKIASFAPLMLEISENIEGTPYFEECLDAVKNIAMGLRHVLKNNFKNCIDKPVKILFNGSVLLKSDFYKNIMKQYLKSYINAGSLEFFEVDEDVSVICARYSIASGAEV